MTDQYVFDCVVNEWTWKCVDPTQKTVAKSKGSFAYYLDCLSDAQKHGLKGSPVFLNVKGELAAPTPLGPFLHRLA